MTSVNADVSKKCLTSPFSDPSTPSAGMFLANDEPVNLQPSTSRQSDQSRYLHLSSQKLQMSPLTQSSISYGVDNELHGRGGAQTYEWATHLHPWPFLTPDTIMPLTATITSPASCTWSSAAGYTPFSAFGIDRDRTDMDGDSYMWQHDGADGAHQSTLAIFQPNLWIPHMHPSTVQYEIMDTDFMDLSSSVPYGLNCVAPDPSAPDGMTSNFGSLSFAVVGTEQNVPDKAVSMLPSESELNDSLPLTEREKSLEPLPSRNKARLRPRPPASCLICNTQFNRRSDLRRHMYEHEGQHECTICGKRYHEKYQLSNHEKSHAGPHPCAECPKIFETRSSLRSHLATHEDSPKLLACPVSGCGRHYRRGGCLNRHVKSVRPPH